MLPPVHARPVRTRRALHPGRLRCLPALLASVATATPAAGQTLEDGLLVAARQLRTTVAYGHDAWDQYWEGGLRRRNENIGTLTTQSVAWTGAYGVTDRLTVVATLPYVWTSASEGVLRGMRGSQDLTVAAKYRLLQSPVAGRATLRAIAVVGAGVPTSDYTPDFLPLSIGLASRRVLARATVHVQDRAGWFVDASAGRAWRSNVRLDRPAYYTDGRLVHSDEVDMPDVADYVASVGYQRGRLCLPVGVSVQRTLGGGDIRRQDMPFVSNRMDFTRAHVMAMYTLPVPSSVTIGLGAMRTLSGRNVGQSTTLMGGITHALRF